MSSDRINKMFEYMDFCNGEIRVMAGRYGGGWLGCGCATIEWDFDEQWNDLIGGDNDYFRAIDFFYANDEIALIEGAKTPQDAFNLCAEKMAAITDKLRA
jgi:hypothetical protein